jgi:hypothetical protein
VAESTKTSVFKSVAGRKDSKIRRDVPDLSSQKRAVESESAMIRGPFGTNARILPIRAKCLRRNVAEAKSWTKVEIGDALRAAKNKFQCANKLSFTQNYTFC